MVFALQAQVEALLANRSPVEAPSGTSVNKEDIPFDSTVPNTPIIPVEALSSHSQEISMLNSTVLNTPTTLGAKRPVKAPIPLSGEESVKLPRLAASHTSVHGDQAIVIGSPVVLFGLTSVEGRKFNGAIGNIVSPVNDRGRIGVLIDGDSVTKFIEPANLRGIT
jgi:hypothetical protein